MSETIGADPFFRISAILLGSRLVLDTLRLVAEEGPADAWVGAGLIRNTVWDHAHGLPSSMPNDIDVAWFDRLNASAEDDLRWENRLQRLDPGRPWQVRNQARMHRRNGHAPYNGAVDGISRWLETATAVAARWTPAGLEIAAPHGLGDLLDLIVRPVPGADPAFVHDRVQSKRWLERWPRLRVVV